MQLKNQLKCFFNSTLKQWNIDYFKQTVFFNKFNSSYRLYNKPNSPILSVNNNFNYPKQVLKQLCLIINQRLINTLNNENSFNNVKHVYKNSLNSSNQKNKPVNDKYLIREI